MPELQLPAGSSAFVVALRGRASAIFPPGQSLSLKAAIAGLPVQVTFQTRYRELGFEDAAPEDVWIDVRGAAPDFDTAIRSFANLALQLNAMVAVSANAFMGDLEIELAFELKSSPGDRRYFQAFVGDRAINVVPASQVDPAAALRLIEAIETRTDKPRITRAVAQYAGCLSNWRLGHELMAVAHSFMGIEAIKHVALRRHLRDTGLTEDQLADQWGFDPKRYQLPREFLLSEARRRLVFQGDDACHRLAKKVSDYFEHGLSDFGDLIPTAQKVLVPTTAYLRRAIIELSEIDGETREVLFAPRFAEPRGPTKMVKYLWAHLESDSDNLAAPGQAYPICEWHSVLRSLKQTPEGHYAITSDERFTIKVAEGVKFMPERWEAWDGSKVNPPASPDLDSSS